MSILDDLNKYVGDYAQGAQLRNNPQALKAYYNNKALQEQRRYNEQQAQKWGQQAGNVYGNQAVPQQMQQQQQEMEGPLMPGQARPMQQVNQVTQPAQQATGVFQGASPEQIRQYGLQKRAMATGQIPGMNMQLGAVNPMLKASMANEQSQYNTTANNTNALQRQQMVNQQSGINNRANNQGQMARTLATNPYNQFSNNKDAYTDFMRTQQEVKDSGNIAKDLIKGENDLQKVYFKESEDFNAIDDAYARVKVAQNTGIGDTSLIFSIMKLMDPRSTVREGEAATAKNSAGLPAWARNLYNEVVDGRSLSPEARNNILAQADDFYGVSKDKYTKTLDKLQGVADRRGYNKENVFTRSFMKDDKGGGKTKPITKPGTKVIKEMTSDMKAELEALRAKYKNK